jgi:hypothetical protein
MSTTHRTEPLGFRKLLVFFLPLGASASLVMISHIIINSTLARSSQPELLVASYSVAMSLMSLGERPTTLLRQTCTRLVRDRLSFKAMSTVAIYLFAFLLVFGLTISYTPLGKMLFLHVFGVKPDHLPDTLKVYRVLMFVSFFSGVRCLYHGVIIYHLRTKWLTIGMGFRLVGMALVSWYFLATDQVNSGSVGAIIFLTGMIIECLVSMVEGLHLVRHKLPAKEPGYEIERSSQVFEFYRPLVFSSLIAVVIGPSINAFLGKSGDMMLAISSYAIASNLAQLMQSFFSYIHQIVLNFYRIDRVMVRKFTLAVAFFPGAMIGLMCYTPFGEWFLVHLMGIQANSELLRGILGAMHVFMIMNLVFPWLDYCNGLIMLFNQTKYMVLSQSCNLAATLIVLVLMIFFAPGLNGTIGAWAQSLGCAAELVVVSLALRGLARHRLRAPNTLSA